MEHKSIGIIGMGDMGKMYARRLSSAGWRINACDVPSKFGELRKLFEGNDNVVICPNGHSVVWVSDYIIYSVEAENIDAVVAEYGPCKFQFLYLNGKTFDSYREQQQDLEQSLAGKHLAKHQR
ncbi:MAG: hypothetical protein Q9165_004376 [Trypethelium subeluteriae]